MRLPTRLLVGAAILACTLASQVAAQSGTGSAHVALTPLALNGRVADAAHIFDPAQTAALASDLAGIEARTGRQVVVATVQTLGDADIAVYARDLGNRLGIGGADENDGIVILLAPNERLVRIAVGPGLEADLTDTVCQRIIDEVMLPDFREGRLFEGLSRGVAALNARM